MKLKKCLKGAAQLHEMVTEYCAERSRQFGRGEFPSSVAIEGIDPDTGAVEVSGTVYWAMGGNEHVGHTVTLEDLTAVEEGRVRDHVRAQLHQATTARDEAEAAKEAAAAAAKEAKDRAIYEQLKAFYGEGNR